MTPEPSAATIPLPFSGIRASVPNIIHSRSHWGARFSRGKGFLLSSDSCESGPGSIFLSQTQAAPGQADSKPIESQGLCLTEADSDILEGVGKLMRLVRWFARLDLTGPFI